MRKFMYHMRVEVRRQLTNLQGSLLPPQDQCLRISRLGGKCLSLPSRHIDPGEVAKGRFLYLQFRNHMLFDVTQAEDLTEHSWTSPCHRIHTQPGSPSTAGRTLPTRIPSPCPDGIMPGHIPFQDRLSSLLHFHILLNRKGQPIPRNLYILLHRVLQRRSCLLMA